jgi:hypothetical protein
LNNIDNLFGYKQKVYQKKWNKKGKVFFGSIDSKCDGFQKGARNRRILKHRKMVSLNVCSPPPPKGIPTLGQKWGLCGHMIPRAMLAVAYATGSLSHARQVKCDDPDKNGYPGLPVWGVGREANNPYPLKIVTKP